MSRLRRLLRKVAKPAAMAAVAASVALSLVVTTPSNAQAFVAPPVLPVLVGATEMVIPELMATSAVLGPVGWGLAGATALGIGLYATKDYWLPYVTGLFGSGTNDTAPNSGDRVATFVTGLKITGGAVSAATSYGQRYEYTLYYSGGSTINKSYVVASWVTCKGADGVVRSAGGPQSSANVSTTSRDKTGATYCPNPGDTLLGAVLAARNAAPEFPTESTLAGPENVWRYGSNTTDGFNPKSPGVKYRVEAECIAPDGTKSFANGYSTGDMAGVTFPSCAAQGKGHGTGNVKIYATPPTTGVEGTTPIWSATAPAANPDRPLCSPQRAGTGCKLAVQLDGKPCVVGLIECENWPDLAKDPNYTTRLGCTYGPYPVPIETCNPLEKAYRPGGSPATTANTDGDPGTSDENQPDGKKVPLPAPPVTGTVPGGDGAPAPAPAPAGTPEASAQECWPNGWAVFNPLEWVLKPIGCAFIPKQDVNKLNQDVVNKANTKAPVAWLGQPLVGPSGGGCPAWVINVGPVHQNVVCGSSFTSAILSVRGPLFLLVATAMVWPLLRSLWYAAIPILRVTPSSGGKS